MLLPGKGRVEGDKNVVSAVGHRDARETDLVQGAHDDLSAASDRVRPVRVGGKRDLSSAEQEVPLQDIPSRQKVAGSPRRGIDFENFTVRDDPGEDLVQKVRIVGSVQDLVGIGRVARDVSQMRHDVVGIGRGEAFKNGLQIAAVGRVARLSDKGFGEPDVRAVHGVHAVHHKVGGKSPDRLPVHRLRRGGFGKSELPADQHAHAPRIGFLQTARLGKVCLGVDHGHGFAVDKNAVRKIVVVEVIGHAVEGRAEACRAVKHLRKGRLSVGGKGAVGMNVCELHTRIIARFPGICNRQSTRRAVTKYFCLVADICSMTA